MRGTIDGAEVYLSEDQLPAFTISVNSLTDPSKISGTRSTTLRVIATAEVKRIMGSEFMAQIPGSAAPILRLNEGGTEVFNSRIRIAAKNRNEYELIAVGGNASWFNEAKGLKLQDLPFDYTDPLTNTLITGSWADEDQPLYFPLIDFGEFAGRDNTYDVPLTSLRPSVRAHVLVSKGAEQIGYRIFPRGRLADVWKKIVIMDPGSNLTIEDTAPFAGPSVTIPGPYPFNEDYTTSNPHPDGLYFIPSIGGTMSVECFEMEVNFNPLTTDYDGFVFRLAVYDFDAGEILASIDFPATYFGDVDYGGLKITHTFTSVPVTAGNRIYMSIQCYDTTAPVPVVLTGDTSTVRYNVNSGAEILYLRPDASLTMAYALMPSSGTFGYFEDYRLSIAACAPPWAFSELLLALSNALCLVFDTDDTLKTISLWFDDEYFRLPPAESNTRDWSTRMDHTVAPLVVHPAKPRSLIQGYKEDDGDLFLRRASKRIGEPFAQNTQANAQGTEKDNTVTLPFAASVNGSVFGGLNIPILRDTEEDYQISTYKRVVRIFIADGIESGDWKLDGVDRTEYPKTYFSLEDTLVPLPFGNSKVDGVVHPSSALAQWERKLREQLEPRTLEAYLFIRDHELQNFDHGMPTLVDDGSGPAWYYVQEIRNHRFGKNVPTRCTLVPLPNMEVAFDAIPVVPFVVPANPFVCAGPGYGSFTIDTGGSGIVTIEGSVGYATARNSATAELITNSVLVFTGDGAHCLWASNAIGEKTGTLTKIMMGDGGPVTQLDTLGFAGLLELEVDNGAFGSAILTGNPHIATLTLYYDAYEQDLTDNGSLINLSLVSANLHTVPLPPVNALESILIVNSNLTAATVNAILANAVANGMTGGTIDLGGGTSAAPTGQGILDKAYLLATTPPNTVTTN